MSAHNKTQLTHARINCALKYSSCVSPLWNILKLIILASNASSSSTKVLKCPNNKDHSMFTHNFSIIYCSRTTYISLTDKDEHIDDFTHRFALIFNQYLFQFTQDQKGLFNACNMTECQGIIMLSGGYHQEFCMNIIFLPYLYHFYSCLEFNPLFNFQ